MKNIFFNKTSLLFTFLAAVTLIISSCEKDGDGSPGYKAGNPIASGISQDSGAVATVLTLKGSGLGDMRSIVFDLNNAPVIFNSTLNTETAIVFHVPDTAVRGQHNIVFTNSQGKVLKIPFKVLPYGVVSSAFPTDFEAGSLVTLTGNNLDVVNKVVLAGTTDQATIISQSLNQAVIQMPASTVDKARLVLTTSAGDKTTEIEFVNVANAAPVFNDALQSGFQNWGWGGTFTASGEQKITGTGSMKAAFDPAGSWGGMQLGGGNVSLTNYKYFTFWAKGADIDVKVQFWLNWQNQKVITIPANKWTYFKYTLATDFPGTTAVDNVTFQIQGDGKTVYFDNIMFVK